MPTATRDELHALIDRLPETELHAVSVFLRFVQQEAWVRASSAPTSWEGRRPSNNQAVVQHAAPDDPVAFALANAPEDDEPSSAEEDALNEARWQAYRRGEHVPHEDVRREIGW